MTKWVHKWTWLWWGNSPPPPSPCWGRDRTALCPPAEVPRPLPRDSKPWPGRKVLEKGKDRSTNMLLYLVFAQWANNVVPGICPMDKQCCIWYFSGQPMLYLVFVQWANSVVFGVCPMSKQCCIDPVFAQWANNVLPGIWLNYWNLLNTFNLLLN